MLLVFITSFVTAQHRGEPQEKEMPANMLIAKSEPRILNHDTFLIKIDLDNDQDKQWYINNIPLLVVQMKIEVKYITTGGVF
jgi:hypothetical protein